MRLEEQLNASTERVSTRTVRFDRPFTLGKSDEAFPAGTYEIETVEQALETATYTAHVRKSQTLIIRTLTGVRCRELVAGDLDTALQRDVDQKLIEPSENPDRENVGGSVSAFSEETPAPITTEACRASR
jgi:hypothetical protein